MIRMNPQFPVSPAPHSHPPLAIPNACFAPIHSVQIPFDLSQEKDKNVDNEGRDRGGGNEQANPPPLLFVNIIP